MNIALCSSDGGANVSSPIATIWLVATGALTFATIAASHHTVMMTDLILSVVAVRDSDNERLESVRPLLLARIVVTGGLCLSLLCYHNSDGI
jgi:hypothetical protein